MIGRGLFPLVVVLGGCGRLAFEPTPDAVLVDAPPALDLFVQPFTNITPLTDVNSAVEDDDPSMTADLLELYFCSKRIGNSDRVFRAVRASPGDPWSTPVELVVLGVPANNARVSLDGLALYFSGARADSQDIDIYRATRATRAEEFGVPVRVVELSSSDRDFEPAVASMGSRVYFTSDRGSTSGDLYEAPRRADGTFGEAVPLAGLSTTLYEGSMWGSDDGRWLWFHREESAGTRRLLQTRRTAPGEPFEAVADIPGITSANDDQDPWVSPDGRTIVFASDRGADAGDLYLATR